MRRHPDSLVFVTGTDTGVGKTVLTALLLNHLRRAGGRALAMKPFATGAPADAVLLDRLQEGGLPMARLNPFRFRAPLAPLVAARREGKAVALGTALAAIRAVRAGCEVLIVEGCGGLLTPLGPGYSARELIAKLGCRVVVCARNRLGVLNQVLLALEVLRANGTPPAAVVLMGVRRPDNSARSNVRALEELALPTPVVSLPWLGARAASKRAILAAASRLRPLLRRLEESLGLSAGGRAGPRRAGSRWSSVLREPSTKRPRRVLWPHGVPSGRTRK